MMGALDFQDTWTTMPQTEGIAVPDFEMTDTVITSLRFNDRSIHTDSRSR